MAEGTYEYECMRAELLGLEKPSEDQFIAQQKEKLINENEEVLEEIEIQSDDLKHVSGGLDELNSILSITQKKLNRFKNACGSLTNLLKLKVGSSSSSESVTMKEVTDDNIKDEEDASTSVQEREGTVSNNSRKSELARALDKNVEKLDALVLKADKAQYSLSHQNKQIKSYLK